MTPTPPATHYIRLRRFLGAMGFALPVILTIGSYVDCNCGHLQSTVSAYYYTHFIGIFCGLLFTIGIFLFTYTGPDHLPLPETLVDRISSNIAGVFAVGVAIFPTGFSTGEKDGCNTQIETWWCGTDLLHILCAGGFFLTLAFISGFVFTKTHKNATEDSATSNEKLFRNLIYRLCAAIIVICVILTGICTRMEKEISAFCPSLKPVFILETVLLFAFGTSWLIKGETLFKDGSPSYNKLPEVLKPKQKQTNKQ